MKVYPLQFEPIFKERIWGGNKLNTFLGKEIESPITGESWELSTVKGDVSVIAKGNYKGLPFNDLIEQFPVEVLGKSVYSRFGKDFPLLFKYLDATNDLSIQVHPDDTLAKQRHSSFGKTEMWYIMQADPEARIIVGFKKDSNATEYVENLENKTLLSIMDEVKVKSGDVFFLEAGTVHAIGAGMVVAEIQQTSDITYRLYDFDRVDDNGKTRELHIDLALEAINYKKIQTQKKYTNIINQSNTIVDCPYFTTNSLPLLGELKVNKTRASFTVYMCIDGIFKINLDGKEFEYKKGDTVFIPAIMNSYVLKGNATVLEIYIS